MQTCKLKRCAHVVKRVSWLKVNSRARLTVQTIMADSVVTKSMCAAVTRKRTDGDGDVVMDNP